MFLKLVAGVITASSAAFGAGVAIASPGPSASAPAPHKSYVAQKAAEVKCASVTDDNKWESCLLNSYAKATGYKLVQGIEYTTNGEKGTWKVTYSRITLPSGGKVVKKATKVKRGIDTTIYCKSYSKTMILCNNGTEFLN